MAAFRSKKISTAHTGAHQTAVVNFLWSLPLASVCLFFLLLNLAILGGAIAAGQVLQRYGAPPMNLRSISRSEWLLSMATVMVNAAISVAGWALWKSGWLTMNTTGSAWQILRDTLILVLVMDFALYALHRIAHLPLFYRIAHFKHHEYREVRVVTLFVMHPLEALGFGSLWVLTLTLFPFTVESVLLFLNLNLYFGVTAHCGLSLYPRALAGALSRFALSDPDFHARHHRDEAFNLGFYTTIWDRLFRTFRA